MTSYLEDIEFILSEVRRFNELVQQRKFEEMGRFDPLCSLPRTGGSFWICGEEAERRLISLASKCIQSSPKTSGKLDARDLTGPLKKEISSQFVEGNLALTAETATKVIRNARESAATSMGAITHFVPCLLAKADDHDEFQFGPVLFLQGDKAICEIRKHRKKEESNNLKKAIAFYSKFPWVARIGHPSCSQRVAENRTREILSYVFDAFTAIFTPSGSAKMGFQDIPPPRTETFKITIVDGGHPNAGMSISWNAHNQNSNWLTQVHSLGFDFFIRSVGKILQDAFYEDQVTPLGERFLNGLKWYGDAAREMSASARIVKFSTSIEAMTATGDSEAKQKIFTERGCALIEGFESEDVRGIRKRLKRLYGWRSDILHGRVPYHHPLWPEAHDAEWLCRHALFGAIQFFIAIGLDNEQGLVPAFERIIAANEAYL